MGIILKRGKAELPSGKGHLQISKGGKLRGVHYVTINGRNFSQYSAQIPDKGTSREVSPPC